MSESSANLPAITGAGTGAANGASNPPPPPQPAAPAASPAAATQLKDLPLLEVQAMARDYGIDPGAYDTKASLVAAILDRRSMIASVDRDAMIDILHWAGRTVTATMSRDRLAMEIAKVRSMRFNGLSQRGLVALAKLRGVPIREGDATPDVIRALKGQEGFFAKIARKRRQVMGKWVSRMLGEDADHQTLPELIEQAGDSSRTNAATGTAQRPTGASSSRPAAGERKLHEEIEESGLIAGLTSRVRRTADQYLNQKLDEIEARIDRKLDEIDRRLSEWRDKEVANRIRILKISLWATVVVGGATLIISYVRVHMRWMF